MYGRHIYELSLDVVKGDGVGDVEAEEEDIGVVEGQRAHGVVGRRACKERIQLELTQFLEYEFESSCFEESGRS